MTTGAAGVRVDGKIAVITGAAHGLGRAVALRLAGEGADIVMGDIDAEQLAQTTIPAAESTMRELEATSRVLRQVTDKLESQGAASILRGQTMPDYEP